MIHVRIPATTANLGPGFDTFGLALGLYNQLQVELSDRDAIVIDPASTTDTCSLSVHPEQNLIFAAMDRCYQTLGQTRPPLKVIMTADIPVARGLGSSSTAIVGGLIAANAMAGGPMSQTDLLMLAIEMEGHPDNVAPALLGGAVLSDGERCYSLPWPSDWAVTVIVPPYEVKTEEARHALPTSVSMQDAIFNLRKASLLTYALFQADAEAFRTSLTDRLHQPYRQALIPEFEAIQTIAAMHGAFGTVISGSGSSIAIFHPALDNVMLYQALDDFQRQQKRAFQLLTPGIDRAGAQVAA